MPTSVAHNHHYVPQFLLRNFVDRNQKLWVYDIDAKTIEARGTKGAASIEDFYAWNRSDGSIDYQTIEDYFGRVIENGAAIAIRKLLRKESLSPEDIVFFFRFAAAQFCRTPAFFSRIRDSMAPVMQEMLERMAKSDPRFRGNVTARLVEKGVTPEEIERLFAATGKGTITAQPGREFVMQQGLKLIDAMADDFSRMRWCFFSVPAGEPDLIIGDHPVTLHDADPTSDGQRPFGIRSRYAEILLPLSPRMTACARWDGPVSYGELESGAAEVVNGRTMRAAQSCVFASFRSDALLQRALEENANGPRVRVQRTTNGEGLTIAAAYY